jgi:hypothetical protein
MSMEPMSFLLMWSFSRSAAVARVSFCIDCVVVKPPVWAETSAASRTGRREKRSRIKVGRGLSVGGR